MSQKKVDYYKEQKANRSEIMKKEKRILMIEKIVAAVVGVFVVCWIIFSVVNKFTATDESAVETVRTAINTSALDDFIDDDAAEGAEEEASEEEAAAEEETTEEETAETEETTEEADASEEPAAEKEASEEETDETTEETKEN